MNDEMADTNIMRLLYGLQDELHEVRRRLTIIDRKLTQMDREKQNQDFSSPYSDVRFYNQDK